jgi:hypothetical protein
MPSFISAQEITDFHQAINDHFDTFKRLITVHKTPSKKITISTSNPQIIGYQTDSIEEQIEYTPISQNFYAIIKYENNATPDLIEQIQIKTSNPIVSIKVKSDAKNYILEGSTEKITFDNKSFNLISTDIVKDYQGLQYYYFYLEETK